MPISPEKEEALQRELKRLGIEEEDIVEKFILGGGSGGQKVNKSHTCVYLCHIPTGLEVKCQETRSRELNRYYARQRLCELIKEKVLKVKTAKAEKAHKIRQQKKRRSRRQKEKMVEEKREQSKKKQLRRPPTED